MKYEYWYANIKGISNRRKSEIRKNVKTAEELYNIEETEWKKGILTEKECQSIFESKRLWDLEKKYTHLVKKGIRLVLIWEEEYPKRLKRLSDAPYGLYVKGKLPEEERMTVAIVGARECSTYGKVMAQEFAEVLSKAGVQIVSGMARGIDSAGQRGALKSGGASFGVLGCGVDICYPREEIGLFMDLQENGGIISEFPPGTQPLRQHFPARNRIISGLSDVILVMEAKEKSGSLITADMALEQGKEVYALPGPISNQLSWGCNWLIKQGAGILISPHDLLKDLGFCNLEQEEIFLRSKILLETTENMVYSCLDFTPRNLRELIGVTKLPVSELLNILMKLELRGVVKEVSKNYYVKVK